MAKRSRIFHKKEARPSFLALRQLYSDALKGMFGSATMLGVGGAGLAVTALVVGLAAGSLVTVLILRRKQRAA